jgi:hypothetical protein
MAAIKHWSEAHYKWEEYKNTHTKEEIIADMEEFFSLDRDSEIAKMMAYFYYDINSF